MRDVKKLALVGYGKMGRLVEQLAPQHGFEVVLRLDGAHNRERQGITAKLLPALMSPLNSQRPKPRRKI